MSGFNRLRGLLFVLETLTSCRQREKLLLIIQYLCGLVSGPDSRHLSPVFFWILPSFSSISLPYSVPVPRFVGLRFSPTSSHELGQSGDRETDRWSRSALGPQLRVFVSSSAGLDTYVAELIAAWHVCSELVLNPPGGLESGSVKRKDSFILLFPG